jgi:hypothetical protein
MGLTRRVAAGAGKNGQCGTCRGTVVKSAQAQPQNTGATQQSSTHFGKRAASSLPSNQLGRCWDCFQQFFPLSEGSVSSERRLR